MLHTRLEETGSPAQDDLIACQQDSSSCSRHLQSRFNTDGEVIVFTIECSVSPSRGFLISRSHIGPFHASLADFSSRAEPCQLLRVMIGLFMCAQASLMSFGHPK